MIYHYFKKIIVVITLLLATLSFLNSCGKVDGSYYDFHNDIHKYDGSISSFLSSQVGVYDSIIKVLDRFPSLNSVLETDSVTFLAPSNTSLVLALNNLNTIRQSQHLTPLYLNDLDSSNMDTLLCRYIIKGIYTTDSVTPQKYIDGIDVYGIKYDYPMHLQYKQTNASGAISAGPLSLIVSDTKQSYFTSAWVTTSTSSVNIYCNNGMVHTLIQSHVFGFGEFTTRLNK